MLIFILFLVAAAAAAPGGACTVPSYPISGSVTRGGGIGIRNARVTARRSEDGYAWSALTNAFGNYRFMVPTCGNFTITATARGYSFDTVNLVLPRDQFADGTIIDFTPR